MAGASRQGNNCKGSLIGQATGSRHHWGGTRKRCRDSRQLRGYDPWGVRGRRRLASLASGLCLGGFGQQNWRGFGGGCRHRHGSERDGAQVCRDLHLGADITWRVRVLEAAWLCGADEKHLGEGSSDRFIQGSSYLLGQLGPHFDGHPCSLLLPPLPVKLLHHHLHRVVLQGLYRALHLLNRPLGNLFFQCGEIYITCAPTVVALLMKTH